ncbi:glycosyltransferase [Sulfurimonas sp.]|uniref:glycosyltransferase family protein n=1 Tax=Sulfurimonas sp. TaxID=2022749 RepID=UPI0035614C4D
MFNTLFISENLSENSHTDDTISGVEANVNLIEKINYTEMYETNGKIYFEKYILKKIEEKNVELLIFAIGAGMIIDIFFLKKISECFDLKIITMFSDSEHLFESNDRYYAQTSDLTWLLSPSTEELFNLYDINSVWTQGFDKNRYPKKELTKSIDISFIGGINRSNRLEYIDFLRENGINVELAGYGTDRGLISVEEKNEIVYKSKINLNFTGVENEDKKIFKRVKQPKGRPMEISMLGGFTLSEYSYGIEKMFDVNKEIDIFHDKEELLEKIKFYLANEKSLEEKAQCAYNRAFREYETNNSFLKVLDALEKIKYVNKTYFIDDNFAKRFTSTRFYYMTKFLIIGELKASFDEIKTIIKYKNITFKNFYFDIPRGIFHVLDKKIIYTRKIVNFLRTK